MESRGKALTGKYNMGALRQIQEVEDHYRNQLATLYSVDEDDLPIDFDILAIVRVPQRDRVDHLRELLSAVPGGRGDELAANIACDLEGIEEGREKVLTGKYNMAALRHMQEIEDKYRIQLSKLFSVDEDDLPFDFDILEIVEVPENERQEHLRQLLSGVPGGRGDEIARNLAAELVGIEPVM